MADRTLTINHADGGSETYTINRDKFAGVREMVVDGADVSVDRTAVPKEQSKETTFGGSQSITVNRDIEPLLSKVVGGAAAAYSLRDLNDSQGNNNVVRVRRESDNSEKDFKAKEVSNGTMARWVNEQPTLPLDLRELDTNTGERDGALIEAAAAYSLRNLSSSGTDVTTSGDTAGDTTGKYVVQVRRSSDDAIKSFTASEVADGTLKSWVNADIVTYESDFSAGTDGWTATNGVVAGNVDNIGGQDNVLRLTVDGTTGSHYAELDSVLRLGQSDRVQLQFYIPSTNTDVDGIKVSDLFQAGPVAVYNSPTLDQWNDVDVSGAATNDSLILQTRKAGSSSFAGNGTDVIYFRAISVTPLNPDGHVRTWYDQSGNTNDATQTDPTKQPKIVDGGTYLEEVDFNGTSHYLDLSSPLGITTEAAVFTVAESGGGTDNLILDNRDSGTDGFRLFKFGSDLEFRWKSVIVDTTTAISSDTKFLGFANHNSSNAYAAINGATATSVADTSSINVAATPRIGARSFTSAASYWDGTINELIIYNSDQSDNRTAIEANIGETYGITAIPAANDTVNGFVQTWYDQSGEGNDAEQGAASSQPKIVDGGSLVTGGILFDGSEYLDHATSLSQPFYLFANYQTSVNNSPVVGADGSSTTAGAAISRRGSGEYIQYAGTPNATGVHGDDKKVASALFDGANSEAYWNGTKILDGDAGTQTNMKRIGGNGSDRFTGSIGEIIIYDSDQSSNRPAIETNIANQYGITLS